MCRFYWDWYHSPKKLSFFGQIVKSVNKKCHTARRPTIEWILVLDATGHWAIERCRMITSREYTLWYWCRWEIGAHRAHSFVSSINRLLRNTTLAPHIISNFFGLSPKPYEHLSICCASGQRGISRGAPSTNPLYRHESGEEVEWLQAPQRG